MWYKVCMGNYHAPEMNKATIVPATLKHWHPNRTRWFDTHLNRRGFTVIEAAPEDLISPFGDNKHVREFLGVLGVSAFILMNHETIGINELPLVTMVDEDEVPVVPSMLSLGMTTPRLSMQGLVELIPIHPEFEQCVDDGQEQIRFVAPKPAV